MTNWMGTISWQNKANFRRRRVGRVWGTGAVGVHSSALAPEASGLSRVRRAKQSQLPHTDRDGCGPAGTEPPLGLCAPNKANFRAGTAWPRGHHSVPPGFHCRAERTNKAKSQERSRKRKPSGGAVAPNKANRWRPVLQTKPILPCQDHRSHRPARLRQSKANFLTDRKGQGSARVLGSPVGAMVRNKANFGTNREGQGPARLPCRRPEQLCETRHARQKSGLAESNLDIRPKTRVGARLGDFCRARQTKPIAPGCPEMGADAEGSPLRESIVRNKAKRR